MDAMQKQPMLVVLIPALNEEKTIAAVIKAIPRKIQGIGKALVLVVDDGSTDRTVEKAAQADRIVSLGSNKGLGIAFRAGIEEALRMGAGIIVNIDADGQFNPRDIEKIIAPILSGKADVVTCSRFLDKTLEPKMPFVKKFGNRFFTKTINLFTGSHFTDTQCGFRAYSREAALRMNLFAKFTYTQEALIDLLQKGMRIKEVACAVMGERHGKSRVVKHPLHYGIHATVIVLRTLRDCDPIQFFGFPGFILAGFGVGLVIFMVIESLVRRMGYLNNGTPPLPNWIFYATILFIIVGFLFIVLALVTDMLGRQRKVEEEILYRLKKKELEELGK